MNKKKFWEREKLWKKIWKKNINKRATQRVLEPALLKPGARRLYPLRQGCSLKESHQKLYLTLALTRCSDGSEIALTWELCVELGPGLHMDVDLMRSHLIWRPFLNFSFAQHELRRMAALKTIETLCMYSVVFVHQLSIYLFKYW